MRVQKVNGRNILCGCILPVGKIFPGQLWTAADDSGWDVLVVDVSGSEVAYIGIKDDVKCDKDFFSFQCRYCLVLDGSGEIPEWVRK